MFLTSYIFKSKAVRALKGNWQTALIVSFLAGLPSTLNWLLRSTRLPEIFAGMTYEELLSAVRQIAPETVWLIAIVGFVTFLVAPVLSVGCNHYFIRRIQGEELGIAGVFSRWKLLGRALLLYVYMYARIFLWSLLFVVPGIVAALRYAMAPYFLAENPEMTPAQAINKSKDAMADKKLSLAVLYLSFIGWAMMALLTQILFLSFSVILAIVAYQFIELFRITYMNASVTAFYLAASRAEGIQKARSEADAFMKEINARMPHGSSGETKRGEDAENGENGNGDEDKGEDKDEEQ